MEQLDNLLSIEGEEADEESRKKELKKVTNLFAANLAVFKTKLKKFGGNITSFMASMKPKLEDEEEKPTPLGAWIAEFDQLGFLRMQFNQSLIPELFYKEDITPELIEFTISSSEDSISPNKLTFEWEATNVNYQLGQIDF